MVNAMVTRLWFWMTISILIVVGCHEWWRDVPSWVSVSVLVMTEFLALRWIVRRWSEDRAFQWIILSSFMVRAAVAVFLYMASVYNWPVLLELQSKNGFWAFGMDSPIYHYYGAAIADAWKYGLLLPHPGLSIDYFLVVGFLYDWWGSHPLHIIMFNCWTASVVALLAYFIGRRLFDRRAGLIAAALIGFWPSSIIWSSQILRDPLCWALILGAELLLLTLLPGGGAGS